MSRLQICSERSEIAEARKSRQDYRRPRRRPFRCSRLQSHCSHLQGLHHWSHLPAHCLPRPRHHCLRPTACAWQLETHRHQLQRWLPRPRLLEFLKAPPPENIFQVKLWHSRAKGAVRPDGRHNPNPPVRENLLQLLRPWCSRPRDCQTQIPRLPPGPLTRPPCCPCSPIRQTRAHRLALSAPADASISLL